MAAKTVCRNCGKKIQDDFAMCPYCGMEVDASEDENEFEDEDDEYEDDEYYEDDEADDEYSDDEESEYEDDEEYYEDDYENLDEKDEDEDDEYEDEEYYEDDEEEVVSVDKKNVKKKVVEKKKTPVKQPQEKRPVNKNQRTTPIGTPSGNGFVPIDINKNVAKASVPKQRATAPKKKEPPYDANHDHYYDDVLPEVLDDIRSHTAENVLKAIGCIAALLLIIWYLIYFL